MAVLLLVGSGLEGASAVTIDGAAVAFTQELTGLDRAAAVLTTTAPPHAVGRVSIVVTAPAGTSRRVRVGGYESAGTSPPAQLTYVR